MELLIIWIKIIGISLILTVVIVCIIQPEKSDGGDADMRNLAKFGIVSMVAFSIFVLFVAIFKGGI